MRLTTRTLLASSAILLVSSGVSQAAATATGACRSDVHISVVPTWARTGFSQAKPRMPYALGKSGNIVAILWASHNALVSPPLKDRNNKILWVARAPLPVEKVTTFYIRAQRMVGTRNIGTPVNRIVQGGPGPSIINLPAAGCWRLALHWAGHSDSLDVRYAANRS
jgi:hypothetical protein